MVKLYRITHLMNDRQQTVAVEAHNADAAQEQFIDHCESIGVQHGTILSIRAAREA